MNYSLNSLKGIISGTTIGHIKGDTRSLDVSSCELWYNKVVKSCRN